MPIHSNPTIAAPAAQVINFNSLGAITQKNGWVLLQATINFPVSYSWITIGNFANDANSAVSWQGITICNLLEQNINANNPDVSKGAYYYIDDVSLVPEPGTAAISASNIVVCNGQSVQLAASGGNGNYTWSSSQGGTFPNTSTIYVTPASTTTYSVSTFNSGYGCIITTSVSILVNPLPVIQLNNEERICKGASIQLAASGATSYSWSPSTGLSDPNIANPIASPTATTTYMVTGTVNGCQSTAQVTVEVNDPTFTIQGSLTSCPEADNTYTLLPSDPHSIFTVLNSNGTVSISSNPLDFFAIWNDASGGTLDVTLTDSHGCSTTSSLYVGSCCIPDAPNSNNSFTNKTATDVLATIGGNSGNGCAGCSNIRNQIFSINGTLTVDVDLTIEASTMLMGYASKIDVLPGKTLTITSYGDPGSPSHIYACNEMWDGIYVTNPTSAVKIYKGATIEDAQYAIYSDAGGNYVVDGTSSLGSIIFNKNFRSIYVTSYPNATHPGTVKAATFKCYDGVVGGNPQNTSNTLHYPHINRRSFAGIDVNNVSYIKIGSPVALSHKNSFDNLDFGIRTYMTGSEIYNNHFVNITLPSGYTSPTKNEACIPGTAICATNYKNLWRTVNVGNINNANTAGNYYKNTFYLCFRGIVAANGMNAIIWKNTMDQIRDKGISFQYNSNKIAVVAENVINNALTGIYSFRNANSNNNFLKNDIDAFGIFNAVGINVQELSPSAYYQIKANTIHQIKDGIVVTGASYNSLFAAPSLIMSNNITTYTYPVYKMQSGIYVTNSNRCVVNGNWIDGSSSSNTRVNGIRQDMSVGNTVECNESHNLGNGLFFANNNYPTNVIKNLMHNNYYGLVLHNGGVIGFQYTNQGAVLYPNDNRWTGTFPSACYTLANGSNGNFSKFFVRNNSLPYSVTANFNCTSTPSNEIRFNSIGNNMNWFTCPPILFPNDDDGKKAAILEMLYAEDSTSTEEDSIANYVMKAQFYKYLLLDSTMLSNDTALQQFMQECENNNISELDAIETTVGDLPNVDSTSIQSAGASLQNINPRNTVEDNSKWIYSLLYDMYEQGISDYDSASLAHLQALAMLCPYKEGKAVYLARVLLSEIDTTQYLNDCELLVPEEERSKLARTTESALFGKISLAPNPNAGVYFLSYQVEEASLLEMQLIDTKGITLTTIKLPSGIQENLQIKTTELNPGVYFCKFYNNGTWIQSSKLIITK